MQSVKQRFPDLMEQCCEVPIELILEQLREARDGKPILGEWSADGDFPEAAIKVRGERKANLQSETNAEPTEEETVAGTKRVG